MKQVVLRIDDAAYEKFMGMVSLCPMVEVVNVCQAKDARQMTNHYVMAAIREMRQTRAFRYPCDYAFLMVAFNESVVKGLPFFYSPKDFLDYMKDSDFDDLPGRSTIYNTIAKVKGEYALRRKNLIKQFLSAFVKAQSGMLDGLSDDF